MARNPSSEVSQAFSVGFDAVLESLRRAVQASFTRSTGSRTNEDNHAQEQDAACTLVSELKQVTEIVGFMDLTTVNSVQFVLTSNRLSFSIRN